MNPLVKCTKWVEFRLALSQLAEYKKSAVIQCFTL